MAQAVSYLQGIAEAEHAEAAILLSGLENKLTQLRDAAVTYGEFCSQHQATTQLGIPIELQRVLVDVIIAGKAGDGPESVTLTHHDITTVLADFSDCLTSLGNQIAVTTLKALTDDLVSLLEKGVAVYNQETGASITIVAKELELLPNDIWHSICQNSFPSYYHQLRSVSKLHHELSEVARFQKRQCINFHRIKTEEDRKAFLQYFKDLKVPELAIKFERGHPHGWYLFDEFCRSLAKNENIKAIQIDISSCDARDGHAGSLARLKQLTSLNISRNTLTTAGAAYLSGLKQLTSLNISSNILENSGARYLREMPQLTSLFISRNRLTTDGVAALANNLPQLTLLDISNVLPSSLQEGWKPFLQQRLPKAKIIF